MVVIVKEYYVEKSHVGRIYIQGNIYQIEIRKDKHAVSNAINILNSSIDAKICKAGNNSTAEKAGSCGKPSSNWTANKKLSNLWSSDSGNGGYYDPKGTDKMGEHTSVTISKDTSELSREEKGVMSSVFAKVIEGAEILDSNNVDTKICKTNAYKHSNGSKGTETSGKCCAYDGNTAQSGSTVVG